MVKRDDPQWTTLVWTIWACRRNVAKTTQTRSRVVSSLTAEAHLTMPSVRINALDKTENWMQRGDSVTSAVTRWSRSLRARRRRSSDDARVMTSTAAALHPVQDWRTLQGARALQQRLWTFFFEEERPKHFEKANCRTGFVVAVGLGNSGGGSRSWAKLALLLMSLKGGRNAQKHYHWLTALRNESWESRHDFLIARLALTAWRDVT